MFDVQFSCFKFKICIECKFVAATTVAFICELFQYINIYVHRITEHHFRQLKFKQVGMCAFGACFVNSKHSYRRAWDFILDWLEQTMWTTGVCFRRRCFVYIFCCLFRRCFMPLCVWRLRTSIAKQREGRKIAYITYSSITLPRI